MIGPANPNSQSCDWTCWIPGHDWSKRLLQFDWSSGVFECDWTSRILDADWFSLCREAAGRLGREGSHRDPSSGVLKYGILTYLCTYISISIEINADFLKGRFVPSKPYNTLQRTKRYTVLASLAETPECWNWPSQ